MGDGVIATGYVYNDYTITLDSKDYNGSQFAAEIQSKITAITGGAATTCSYDALTRKMSVSFVNLDINLFTDKELGNPLYGWNGTPYNTRNSSCGNELLTNVFPNVVGNTASPATYYLNLIPVRNIYMRSPNLSSFNTIGPDG